jgi:hypothetical protein
MIRQLTLALTVLCAPPLVVAQDGLNTTERLDVFRRLNANADGWLSGAEAAKRAEVSANFQRADVDRDSRLSFAEFETIALNRSDQPGRFRNPDRG